MPAAVDPYDELPYTDHAYAEAHPDRLAVVARLSGWEAPDPERARVLELGCGRGGHLLPMASALPRATLLGVDRSGRQIDEARAIAAATALANVTFVQSSFDALDGGGPAYDFVLCHGVCSWIPAPARKELLRVVARSLTPSGVAYVSFNVLPGWYDRLAARDWLRAHAGEDARAALAWLRDHVSPELGDYRRRLDAVARRLDAAGRAYAVHEYLAGDNHPQQVSELLAEAEQAGLVYLGDAIPAETALELLPDDVAVRAQGLDVAATQQLIDFVRCTAFRRALFVRADAGEARGWRWAPRLDASAMETLRVASRLRPHAAEVPGVAAEQFDGPEASVQVAEPTARRALRELARIAPRSLPFPELAQRVGATPADVLRRELFDLWLATGSVDLHACEPAIAGADAASPRACPVAAWHARHGGAVTNRWHQEVRLDDRLLRWVLGRLDGSRTSDDLARELRDAFPGAGARDEDLAAVARASIAALARSALLIE
ncbi:MAG TPA: methyltransferase domain-containing protein [Polyangiaceae bacterium]